VKALQRLDDNPSNVRRGGARGAPVVIIGMHRSGTSMIVRMLRRLGVFTGWELDANGEAIFFVLRNRAILESQGARWDRPGPIDELLDHGPLRHRLADTLRRDLSTPAVASYLGPIGYLRYRSLQRFERAWGWKDPRNTLLLPLWLEIFPSARVVHVVRNGVDVALSLARREQHRIDYVLGDPEAVRDFVRQTRRPPDGCGRLAWAFSQLRLRLRSEHFRRRFGQLRIHPVIDPARGFELWEQYLTCAERHAESVHGGMLQLRYEDVLRDPSGEVERLAAFCGLEVDRDRREEAASVVDVSRPSQPEQEAAAQRLFEVVADSPWLRRLGYRRPAPGSQ